MTQNSNANVHELIQDQGIPQPGDESLDMIDNLLGEDKGGNEEQEFYKQENFDDEEQLPNENEEKTSDNEEEENETEETELENNTDDAIDYNQEIDVPMPYGMESMTLSELKDKASNMHMEVKKVQEQENELMVQRQEINAIMTAMGDIPPEINQALKNQHQALLRRENQLLIEAVPEWKDMTTFDSDRQSMETLTNSYGFSEQEFNHVADHRLVKMIRDFSLLKLKLEKADPKKIQAKKQKPARSKQKQSKRDANFINDAAKSNNAQMKQAAINKLLE